MRKYAAFVVLLLILGVFGWLFYQGDNQVLGEGAEVYAYTFDGVSTRAGVVSVPFLRAGQNGGVVNILADLDEDGSFTGEGEWLVRNQQAKTRTDYRNNFRYQTSLTFNQELPLRIVLTRERLGEDWDRTSVDGEMINSTAVVQPHNLTEILGLDVPGADPELKRGAAAGFALIKEVQAQGGGRSTFRSAPTPDINQGPMECAVASAANNIISLASDNDRGRDVPADQDQMIEELRRDMQFGNGVLNSNFVDGKNAFAARHNLPIQTTRIDEPTWQDIFNAIQEGAAVEMSMSFIQSASGHANTGHTVTAVGASVDGAGNQSVQIHDPATPSGMDSLDLPQTIQAGSRRFEGVNYPMWDGIAFIDAIFVQRWGTEVPESPGTITEQEQIDRAFVEMLVIDGAYYPAHQFRVADPDECGSQHYHASGTVYGLKSRFSSDIVSSTDPRPRGCGFGTVSEIPRESINLTEEQQIELVKNLVDR